MTTIFSETNQWLTQWLNSQDESASIVHHEKNHLLFILKELSQSKKPLRPFYFIFSNSSSAQSAYEFLKPLREDVPIFLLDISLENIYEDQTYGQFELESWSKYLNFIINNKNEHHILILTSDALLQRLPPLDFYEENNLFLKIGQEQDPFEVTEFLLELGYRSAPDVFEPSTFSRKGSILDIHTSTGLTLRAKFEKDVLNEVKGIDLNTFRTIESDSYQQLDIPCGKFKLLDKELSSNFKKAVQSPNLKQKEKYLYRKEVFALLNNGIIFKQFEPYWSLFFENSNSLLKQIKNEPVYVLFNKNEIEKSLIYVQENLRESYKASIQDIKNLSLLPSPEKLIDNSSYRNIFKQKRIQYFSNDSHFESSDNVLNLNISPSDSFISEYLDISAGSSIFERKINAIKKILKQKTKVIFFSKNNNLTEEIKFLFEEETGFQIINQYLPQGFYIEISKTLILGEEELFKKKTKKTKTASPSDDQLDIFAEQISSLEIGDFVVHKQHGIGRYLGVEVISQEGVNNDFLVIEYDKDDKVYLPSYKINQIQKHSSKNQNQKVANLRSNKFDATKRKISEKIKTLAFDLVKLQAKRHLSKAYSFTCDEKTEREFGLLFPYTETPDQTKAIENVFKDMENSLPMDHLVCGDVGFGKTEVAIRAAHKAVLNKKQVVVLVPTTILSLQHYNSFIERFKTTAVNIELVSRLRKSSEVKEIIHKVENGLIDIVIGTHKVLSDQFKFKDLGLVIIDEEQRFGVAHKERFKLLRESIDFLTLSATPIPRTMQLAFLNLKQFSIIRTPPPKRQSIKTYLVREDDHVIKQAIDYEMSRGGQVFIVHNKVIDLEDVFLRVKELCPKARVTFAHGQMKPSELEEKVLSFYKGKYDVLIATTIIESGIDIPNANTLIVSNADRFGLSQLHQLRGRIGRSDRKAFCYLMVKDFLRLSDIANKRLKALQNYSNIGAGFSIASVDLELRGAGDILGPEQSGHLDEIGLELYMEILKDAIQSLKNENITKSFETEIITDLSSKIPENYMGSQSERLRYYKLLSNSQEINRLEKLEEELFDIYGDLPIEVSNLINIIKVRIRFNRLGATKIKKVNNEVTISFDDQFFKSNEASFTKILDLITSRPKYFSLNNKGELRCRSKDKLTENNFITYMLYIAENIKAC